MIEFSQSVLGMDGEQAMWDTPVASLTRRMAAYVERQGQSVNWDGDRTERIIDRLEALVGDAETDTTG